MDYLYCELAKGNIYRFQVLRESGDCFEIVCAGVTAEIPKEPGMDGSFAWGGYRFWPETEEWKVKYQDSLSLRVSQHPLTVYMVMPIKRGKLNSRVLVIDGEGATYHGLVPTVPMPVLGQSLRFLRLDLTPVSLVPANDILEKVQKARAGNSLL
jgi:hypothetical protein